MADMDFIPPPTSVTLPVRFFSTDDVAPHQRHDLWRSQGWPSIGQLLESTAEPDFSARSQMLVLTDTTVTLGRYGTQTVHRTPALIRQTPVDHLHVAIPLDADLRTTGGTARAGTTIVIDLAQEWRHHAPEGRMVTIAVPRARALEHGIDPGAVHGTLLPSNAATLLREHALQMIAQAEQLPAAAAYRLAGTVVDLVAVALLANHRSALPTEAAVDEVLRQRASRMILSSLTQPWLDAGHLAGALGISRSRLYRLFADKGGVQRTIRRERLLAASAALISSTMTIGEVAARFRFGDTAHFARAFRAMFGMSPSEWRTANRDNVLTSANGQSSRSS